MQLRAIARPGLSKGLVICLLLVLAGNFPTARGASDDIGSQRPQAIVNIDLATANPSVTVVGGAVDDHLSGNGATDSFGVFPRSGALATGDFNNDGIADLLIGAPDLDFTPAGGPTRDDSGAAYVIFGRPVFPPFIDANPIAFGQPDIRIFGSASGDMLGFAVAAGDVNGDGIDDILIGAPGADFPGVGETPTPRDDTGAVFVLLGSAVLVGGTTIDLATENAASSAVFGEHTGDLLGSSIATGNAGGEPIPDLLIGAPGSQGPDPVGSARPDGGAAFLLFGGDRFNRTGAETTVIDLGTTTADVRVFGRTGSLLGSSLAIGDVNAGGSPDLIIGAPMENRPALPPSISDATASGGVFIVFGGSNLNPTPPATTRLIDIASLSVGTRPNVSIFGNSADDHLGAAVAAGDVSGDGIIDLVMGAPGGDGSNELRLDAGEVYIITAPNEFNPPPGQVEKRIDVSVLTVSVTIFGAQAGEALGSALAVGHVNLAGSNDTINDLIVGAPGFDAESRPNAGAVSVLFGGQFLVALSQRDLALDQDNVRVIGQAGGDELGWAVAAADLDNNTGGDLIIGAPFNDAQPGAGAARTDAGEVYVLLAAPSDTPPVNQIPVVQVTAPNGGEAVLGGSTFNITWTATDPDGDHTLQRFEIGLSTDGGATFPAILAAAVAGTSRNFQWNVPIGTNTSMARVRVIAFDNAGGQAQDISNANFTITDVGVTVVLLDPNGGETLRFGETFTISWEVPPALAPQVRGFDVFLSTDGGATFDIPIHFISPTEPALEAATRSVEWTVSQICATQARMLVSATTLSGLKSFDSSNGNFSIFSTAPTVDLSKVKTNNNVAKVLVKTGPPQGGQEVRFTEDTTLELSTDEAGTQFFSFANTVVNANRKKIQGKGRINGLRLRDYMPDGATRLLRLSNPPCGLVLLRIRRVGSELVVVDTVIPASVWP